MQRLLDFSTVEVRGQAGIAVDQITRIPQRIRQQRTLQIRLIHVEAWIHAVRAVIDRFPQIAVRVRGRVEVELRLRAIGWELQEILAVLGIAALLVLGGEVGYESVVEAHEVVVLLDKGVDGDGIEVVVGADAGVVD